jgi:hypothetical protein
MLEEEEVQWEQSYVRKMVIGLPKSTITMASL